MTALSLSLPGIPPWSTRLHRSVPPGTHGETHPVPVSLSSVLPAPVLDSLDSPLEVTGSAAPLELPVSGSGSVHNPAYGPARSL
jgi:hypothetical protein